MSVFTVEERNDLLIENVNLIWSRVHHWAPIKRMIYEKDILFSEGVIGMIKAIESYDPEKGKLSVHMYNSIDGYVRNANRLKKHEDLVSMETPSEQDETLTIGNMLSNDDSVENSPSAKIDFNEKILPIMEEVLDDKEIYVIKCRFGVSGIEPQNLETIKLVLEHGLQYHCSIQNIIHIERRAISKIRDALLNTDEMIKVEHSEWRKRYLKKGICA